MGVSNEGASHALSAADALITRDATEGPRDATNHGCECHKH